MPTDPLLPELEQRLQDIKVNLASNDKAAEANTNPCGTMQDEISERYLRIYEELNELSNYIDDAKAQIAVLCHRFESGCPDQLSGTKKGKRGAGNPAPSMIEAL